jgi:hypothetical protein
LIRENELVSFAAGQRYADYLGIAASGAFGGVELPPGRTPESVLLSEPHVEVVRFSWFNPDPITGNFASEIRFGYLVENGVRRPFKGGQLIGNFSMPWRTSAGAQRPDSMEVISARGRRGLRISRWRGKVNVNRNS